MHFDLRNSSLIKHIHTYVDRTWIIDLELDHDDGGKRELVDRHKNEALAFFFFFWSTSLLHVYSRRTKERRAEESESESESDQGPI